MPVFRANTKGEAGSGDAGSYRVFRHSSEGQEGLHYELTYLGGATLRGIDNQVGPLFLSGRQVWGSLLSARRG